MDTVTLIQTDKSALTLYKVPDLLPLLNECVVETFDLLLVDPEIMIYGRVAHQQRSVGFFADPGVDGYKYSGQTAISQPLTPATRELLERINILFATEFNGILENYYADGNKYISAHSDDESALAPIGVMSISFGTTRKFRIRNKKTKAIIIDVPVKSGDILLMSGDFQKEFTHEIPKETTVHGERFSFTFRRHATHSSK